MRAILIFMELTIRAGIMLLKILGLVVGVALVVKMFTDPSIMALCGLLGVMALAGQYLYRKYKKK